MTMETPTLCPHIKADSVEYIGTVTRQGTPHLSCTICAVDRMIAMNDPASVADGLYLDYVDSREVIRELLTRLQHHDPVKVKKHSLSKANTIVYSRVRETR